MFRLARCGQPGCSIRLQRCLFRAVRYNYLIRQLQTLALQTKGQMPIFGWKPGEAREAIHQPEEERWLNRILAVLFLPRAVERRVHEQLPHDPCGVETEASIAQRCKKVKENAAAAKESKDRHISARLL